MLPKHSKGSLTHQYSNNVVICSNDKLKTVIIIFLHFILTDIVSLKLFTSYTVSSLFSNFLFYIK